MRYPIACVTCRYVQHLTAFAKKAATTSGSFSPKRLTWRLTERLTRRLLPLAGRSTASNALLQLACGSADPLVVCVAPDSGSSTTGGAPRASSSRHAVEDRRAWLTS